MPNCWYCQHYFFFPGLKIFYNVSYFYVNISIPSFYMRGKKLSYNFNDEILLMKTFVLLSIRIWTKVLKYGHSFVDCCFHRNLVVIVLSPAKVVEYMSHFINLQTLKDKVIKIFKFNVIAHFFLDDELNIMIRINCA